MQHLSQQAITAMSKAVLVARDCGHAEVGLLHVLCGILELEPELASDLTTAQIRKVIPASMGEFRFKPEVLTALERAHWYIAEQVEPDEKNCLEALLEPGRALVLLAHHLGLPPEDWRQQISQGPPSGRGLELLPDLNEWRMLLTWLENPLSQVRSWLNDQQAESAIQWVECIVGPYPNSSDTGWLTLARQLAARDAGRQPLSSRRLFHALLQQREVALLQWRLGGSWLSPAALHSFWHSPGLPVARHYGHSEVNDLHLLLDCLNEPLLQADLNPLRQAVRKVLEGKQGNSYRVTKVLRRTLKYCSRWRVEPGRSHVAYVVLREFATDGIADALELSGRDAKTWLRRLRRLIIGRLRPGNWTVDGVRLGEAASALGPLRPIEVGWETLAGTHVWFDDAGNVNRVQGSTLFCGGAELLGPTTRHYSAEALVGIGRLERWLPFGAVEMEVRCDGGYVAHVGLRPFDHP